MKRLLLSLMMPFALLISFTITAKAQDIPDDDDVIVIDVTHNTTETGPQRSIIPIYATFCPSLSLVEIEFLFNIGEVTVCLTNLTASSMTSTAVDSSFGGCILPVTGGPGLYCLEFLLSDGTRYYGYFLIP